MEIKTGSLTCTSTGYGKGITNVKKQATGKSIYI